ncbi:unnamed protein product [Prunus armeniaca]|uniref:RNase H type-1 domain-containing protein n=1 Tax=Prunus armeniaca TaxID=36596 RepID=A0A6J5VTL9_PRUAR|nr:unnamed protein product [Prunus armeniaca]
MALFSSSRFMYLNFSWMLSQFISLYLDCLTDKELRHFGALKTDNSVRGLGVAIRDDRGELIAAAAKLVCGMFTPNVTELFTIRFGLQLAMDLGLKHIYLESDAQAAIRMALQCDADLGYEGVFVNEIQKSNALNIRRRSI